MESMHRSASMVRGHGARIRAAQPHLCLNPGHHGAPTDRQEPDRMNDDGPSVLAMIGAVALGVALVILVFFAAGYGFGRLFL